MCAKLDMLFDLFSHKLASGNKSKKYFKAAVLIFWHPRSSIILENYPSSANGREGAKRHKVADRSTLVYVI